MFELANIVKYKNMLNDCCKLEQYIRLKTFQKSYLDQKKNTFDLSAMYVSSGNLYIAVEDKLS